jgi:hypothetical protein
VLRLQTVYYSNVGGGEEEMRTPFYRALNLKLSAETGKQFTPFH